MPLNENDIPNKQSALVLQGGGALGAYEAGALTVLCKELTYEYREGPLFDIVAGTSIGAMNAAVLISNVVNRKKTWEEAAKELENFWIDEKKGLSSTPGFSRARKKFDRTFGGNILIILWLQKSVHRRQMLIALKRNNRNVLNWLTALYVMTNSNKCIQNEHESCDGIVKTVLDGSDNTKMCDCQCHNSSYQMVQKMFGVINQKD